MGQRLSNAPETAPREKGLTGAGSVVGRWGGVLQGSGVGMGGVGVYLMIGQRVFKPQPFLSIVL